MGNYQIVIVALGVCCASLTLVIWQLNRTIDNLRIENAQLNKQLEDAVRRLAVFEREPGSKHKDKLIKLLIGAGVPGLIFAGAVALSGFYGAAAITSVLAALGGPWGMLVGVNVLILLAATLSQYGIPEVTQAVARGLLRAKSKSQIIREIDKLPRLVPQKLRITAKTLLEDV
jgi:predicted PurR-regulated permease PerM